MDTEEAVLVSGCQRQKMANMQLAVRHPSHGSAPSHTSLMKFRCIGVIGFGVYLLFQGMSNINIYDIKTLWGLGFGTVNTNSVVGIAPTGLIPTTLFANLPQGILSFLYLTYNGLFSCMLGVHEWSRFARFRKSLRVTAPEGSQRSTYYLQLPYTYALVCFPAVVLKEECPN